MLPFGVTIPATVPQGSEIPEGLMNNPVLWKHILKERALSFFVSNFRLVVNVVFFLFWWFTGVWILCADVSEDVLKRRHKQYRRLGITQKKEYSSIKFVDRIMFPTKPDQRQALANTLMNVRAPQTAGNFLTSWNSKNENYCKLVGYP